MCYRLSYDHYVSSWIMFLTTCLWGVSRIWNNVIFNNGMRLNFALNSAILLWKRTVNWWKCSVMKPWVVLSCFDGIQFLKMVMKASGINRRPNIEKCKSKVKTMMICFFDSKDIVHKESVPPGQSVNQHERLINRKPNPNLKVLDQCESLESI